MSDPKSKLPDLKEMMSFTSKLFNDVKKSVCEIFNEYKQSRASDEEASAEPEKEVKADSVSTENHEKNKTEDKSTKSAKSAKSKSD